MKKLLITCFLLGSFAYGQTPQLVVGDTTYRIVEEVDVSCLPNAYQSLRALQPWEQCLFSLGFTRVPGAIREWEMTTNGRRDWVRLSTNGYQGQYNGVFFGLGGANPVIPDDIACTPPTLAAWEHAAIGAGFTHAAGGTYTRPDGLSIYSEDEFGWTVEGPGITGNDRFPTTLAQVVALIYRGR